MAYLNLKDEIIFKYKKILEMAYLNLKDKMKFEFKNIEDGLSELER